MISTAGYDYTALHKAHEEEFYARECEAEAWKLREEIFRLEAKAKEHRNRGMELRRGLSSGTAD